MAKAQQILMQLAINNGATVVWPEDGATLASKIEQARSVWKAAIQKGKV